MPETIKSASDELIDLRIEQASMLKKRVNGSCLIVLFLISYTAIIMYLVSGFQTAAIWLLSGSFMVLVTYLYAKLASPGGITRETYKSYLFGHIIVSALTGLVWGAIAIYQTNFEQQYTVFIGCLLVSSITLGGVLPSSAYRPGYVALSLFCIPPFSIFLMINAPAPFGLVGFAMLVFFAFAMFLSARVEIETREAIAARQKKELTEKVIEQNKVIQKTSEEKTRFLAATGHDLSQPLQSQGFFMQALRDTLTQSDQIALLNQVEESWRAQKGLLQGILDVSRIDSGAIVPKPALVDITELCEKLAREFLSDETLAIELISRFEKIETVTDPVLFSRIIRNILSNARKFVPAGGEVNFTLRQIDGWAEISITDNGPGMSEDNLGRIFDEYVQLETGGFKKPKGLGLGLAIVKRLCVLLDIQMSVSSKEKVGTTFQFKCPIRKSGEIPQSHIQSKMTRFTSSPLVVVVDDDETVLASMTQLLSGWNCQVISATNQEDAIDLISRTSAIPVLLIIDKQLGQKESGTDLIAMLREEVNAIVPAILMSGQLGNIENLFAGENVEFLNKPVEPEEIWQSLDSLVNIQGTETAEV
ncbi:MAG: hypothetical protein Pars2KO_03850 [Parasphingorhabdus sp.]